MFRCKECGCEYEVKPDFCECGNDEFDFTEKEPDIVFSKKLKPLALKELLSWLIFGICVILSVLVLLFFPKINPDGSVEPENVRQEVMHENIPSIESFWVDTVKIEKPAKPDEEYRIDILKVLEKKQDTKKKVPEQKIVKTQNKVTQTKSNTQTSQVQTKKTEQKKVVKTQQQKKTKYTDTEMRSYIGGLLNRFRSNLSLGELDGEGECIVGFTLDENGKLLNRKFVKQSENKSVNDTIYKMMMRTPVFDPPPASYDGGLLKVYLKLSPSYYEISFMN